MKSVRPVLLRHRRVFAVIILVTTAVLLVLAQPVHNWLLSLFDDATVLIRQRAAWGMLAFVVLAALSAMIAFVSSAVLVPVAIQVWGPVVCFVLLWLGWFMGGLAGYGIGRFLGRPAVEILVRRKTLARYEGWARSGKSLVPMLMLQLAIPSDLASYVFGLVRCRFIAFAGALALAEVPYALGAVYLGESFLQARILPLLVLGLAGVLLSVWAVYRLRDIHGLLDTSASSSSPEPTRVASDQAAPGA
ncbi:MAG TPA: VTT domain-containing protein [Gemmatimonadales bacterium]|nr:VTT domain-containing protein [Gemmatimonadales bacterium]